MKERRFGHVVNISSIGVQTSPPRFSAYVASKAALDAWTRVVASEVVGDGITFTTIHMPLVRTPMIAPTKIYDSFPTISPDEAADLICEAIRAKPKSINTRLGTFGEVAYALAPKAVDQILHMAYKVFPDSAAAQGREGPGREGLDGAGRDGEPDEGRALVDRTAAPDRASPPSRRARCDATLTTALRGGASSRRFSERDGRRENGAARSSRTDRRQRGHQPARPRAQGLRVLGLLRRRRGGDRRRVEPGRTSHPTVRPLERTRGRELGHLRRPVHRSPGRRAHRRVRRAPPAVVARDGAGHHRSDVVGPASRQRGAAEGRRAPS